MLRFTFERRWWPAFVLGIMATLLGGVLWQGLHSPPPAYGQIPDSGAQRQEMIKELRAANAKLAEIAELLREIRDSAAPPAGRPPTTRERPRQP